MVWRVWGPLLFATLLFVIVSVVKIVAFENYQFYLDLAPELALWATGVLFSLAVSDHARFGGRPSHHVRRSASGDGVEIRFGMNLPEQPELSPRITYLFVYAMATWLLTVLLTGKAHALIQKAKSYPFEAVPLVVIAVILAGLSVGLAVRALREVA